MAIAGWTCSTSMAVTLRRSSSTWRSRIGSSVSPSRYKPMSRPSKARFVVRATSSRDTEAQRPRSWLYSASRRGIRSRQSVRTDAARGLALRIATPCSAMPRNTAGLASAGPLKRASNFQVLLGPTPYLRMLIRLSCRLALSCGSYSAIKASISR